MFNDLLKRKKMTQNILAKKLGVTQQLISMWVRGKAQPKIDMVPKLAKVLHEPAEVIIQCFYKSKNR